MKEFYPTGKWEFNRAVAEDFRKMLQRSIPELASLRSLVVDVAKHMGATSVLELGCSDGQMLEELLEADIPHVSGVEKSSAMVEVARSFLQGRAKITHGDITTISDFGDFDLYLCILTLQFVPVEKRLKVLRAIKGPLIFVEKVQAPEIFVQIYHSFKGRNGYSEQEISEKAQALEGVLVPLTAEWNEDLLRQAGYRHVECFWRWMNFAGWIAEK